MDGAAAGHNAGDAVCRQRDVPQQHARMDGEVVHTLARRTTSQDSLQGRQWA